MKLRHGSNTCQCPACGKYFTSPSSFDRHRIGSHGADRRCMSNGELEAAGFEENARGFLRVPNPRFLPTS